METANVNLKNWKSLIKPGKLDINLNDDKSYAKIVAEPLEKGYGLTLGNSLRRILLSSIRGTAVTAIQIDGVLHEFTSIKGVREDVTDIVLNVKSLALKSTSEGPKKLIGDRLYTEVQIRLFWRRLEVGGYLSCGRCAHEHTNAI